VSSTHILDSVCRFLHVPCRVAVSAPHSPLALLSRYTLVRLHSGLTPTSHMNSVDWDLRSYSAPASARPKIIDKTEAVPPERNVPTAHTGPRSGSAPRRLGSRGTPVEPWGTTVMPSARPNPSGAASEPPGDPLEIG